MDRIGVGGFATVWLYHDHELESDVAVKALADNWAQRFDIRERFLEEARILRRADSDHVVRVYDLGEVDGTPYFVMSYADRGSLATLLEAGEPLEPSTVAGLVEQAGIGLSVLHRKGVIHRDIKPQNLLLRSDDDGEAQVLVADLGVAKAMLHASGLTQVVGTPAYMAPEQATGIGVDARADVHALGAVTYQMLTGHQVRKGGLADLMEARMPEPPSTLAPLPMAVDTVLLRAIHPDREERWPDVRSFTRALAEALESADRTRPVVASADGQQGRSGDSATWFASRSIASPPPVLSSPEPEAAPTRPTSRGFLALVFLLVLAVTFGASYAVVTLLR